MYIIEKYWGNYIGSTDDSLTLLEYLIEKQKTEISLSEIFADTGLDKLNWDFRKTELELGYTNPDGLEYPFYYAIDVVTDLAALMLECKINDGVSLMQLLNEEEGSVVRISSTPEEKTAIKKVLADFAKNPLAYDLNEMVPDDDMREMAQVCENLCKELCE